MTAARRRCPACGCTIPAVLFACRDDWRRLPSAIRAEINRTYGAFDLAPAAYLAATAQAVEWFGAHPEPLEPAGWRPDPHAQRREAIR